MTKCGENLELLSPWETQVHDVLTIVPVTTLFLALTRKFGHVSRGLFSAIVFALTYPYPMHIEAAQVDLLMLLENKGSYLCTNRVMTY